jgi:hypothetical protein
MFEYLTYTLLIIGLSSIVGVSIFYKYKFKNLILIFSLILVSISLLGNTFLLLGNPVPLNKVSKFYYSNIKETEVLWFDFKENQYIRVLIQNKNTNIPLYVEMPWNKDIAESLQKADEKSQRDKKSGQAGNIIAKDLFSGEFEDGDLAKESISNTQGVLGEKSQENRPSPFKYNPPSFSPIPKNGN